MSLNEQRAWQIAAGLVVAGSLVLAVLIVVW
jgi:hypothetical protein